METGLEALEMRILSDILLKQNNTQRIKVHNAFTIYFVHYCKTKV